MENKTNDECVFKISKDWINIEFQTRYYRIPTESEMISIKKSLEWGLLFDIDTIFTAAFSEAVES